MGTPGTTFTAFPGVDNDPTSLTSGATESVHQGIGLRNVKVHQPKTYNGDRNFMVMGNWVFSVERYLSLMKIPKDEQVLYISTLFGGEALLWFRSKYEHTDYQSLRWL